MKDEHRLGSEKMLMFSSKKTRQRRWECQGCDPGLASRAESVKAAEGCEDGVGKMGLHPLGP